MYVIYKGVLGIYLKNNIKVAERVEGMVIGETALDNDSPRTANVIAETNVVLLKLKKTDYESIILNLKNLEKHENTRFLMTIPFFQRWSFVKV